MLRDVLMSTLRAKGLLDVYSLSSSKWEGEEKKKSLGHRLMASGTQSGEKELLLCKNKNEMGKKKVIFTLRPLPHFMYVVWLAAQLCVLPLPPQQFSVFPILPVFFKDDQGRCVLKAGRESRTVEAGAGPEAPEEGNRNGRKKGGLCSSLIPQLRDLLLVRSESEAGREEQFCSLNQRLRRMQHLQSQSSWPLCFSHNTPMPMITN